MKSAPNFATWFPFTQARESVALDAALVDGVENAEIVAEEQRVGDVQVGLAGDAGEIVMAAGVLHEEAVHEVGLHCGGQIADQGLIAQEKIVSAAGSADAAAVESAADELIHVTAVFDVVADAEVVVGVQLVINFGDAVIVVLGLEDVQVLGRDAQSFFGSIDEIEILVEHAGIGGGFTAALAFVIGEEKYFVLLDGAAGRSAELILAQDIRVGSRLEEGARVSGVVLQVVVD